MIIRGGEDVMLTVLILEARFHFVLLEHSADLTVTSLASGL